MKLFLFKCYRLLLVVLELIGINTYMQSMHGPLADVTRSPILYVTPCIWQPLRVILLLLRWKCAKYGGNVVVVVVVAFNTNAIDTGHSYRGQQKP